MSNDILRPETVAIIQASIAEQLGHSARLERLGLATEARVPGQGRDLLDAARRLLQAALHQEARLAEWLAAGRKS